MQLPAPCFNAFNPANAPSSTVVPDAVSTPNPDTRNSVIFFSALLWRRSVVSAGNRRRSARRSFCSIRSIRPQHASKPNSIEVKAGISMIRILYQIYPWQQLSSHCGTKHCQTPTSPTQTNLISNPSINHTCQLEALTPIETVAVLIRIGTCRSKG